MPLEYGGVPAGVGGAVTSVAGKTGAVTLTATDVGADAAGAASTAQSTAEAYADTGDAARILKSTRQAKTANYTAVIGDLVAADTTGGTFTVTIPAASGGKGRVLVKWVAGAVAPTIALSGSDHIDTSSGVTSKTPSVLGQGYQFESDGTSIWTVTADDLPLSQLDLRYANLASPALTGTPTAPTASALDNSTKLSTTAYADAAVAVEKARAQAVETILEQNTLLASGESNFDPRFTISSAISGVSQRLQLTYFTALRTETCTQAVVYTGSTAAGATPTLCQIAVYSVDASDNLTLVASTTNDTTLFGSANTRYAKAFSASFTKTAGVRYATAVLVVTAATAPSFCGYSPTIGSITSNTLNTLPRRQGRVASQSSLPSTITAGTVALDGNSLYCEVTP